MLGTSEKRRTIQKFFDDSALRRSMADDSISAKRNGVTSSIALKENASFFTRFIASSNRPKMRCQLCWSLFIGYLTFCMGCAAWRPNGDEPTAVKREILPSRLPNDVAGVETILVRLNVEQSQRLPELWAQVDEQVLRPELRLAMDRNGMRAAKTSGTMPHLLAQWIEETVRRLEEDPLEQIGFAADVSSYSQLWRCRAESKKELNIRNFPGEKICVFFHDGIVKGKTFDAPQFLYAIQAAPTGDGSAQIKLTPEMQYGDPVRKVITRDSAIRTDNRRESVIWDSLMIDLRIQRGDCILIGPTDMARALGEHFFHTKTHQGDLQPVLLIVRLSESELDTTFTPSVPN